MDITYKCAYTRKCYWLCRDKCLKGHEYKCYMKCPDYITAARAKKRLIDRYR